MLGGAFPFAVGPRLLRYALAGSVGTPPVSAYLEMEFAGRGQGWTDVTPDVAWTGWDGDRGLPGTTPVDRVARTGTFHFSLRNDARAVNGIGTYSPDNANCRAGFQINIGVRAFYLVNGVKYPLTTGELDDVTPAPGLFGKYVVECTAVDWMDNAANAPMGGLSVLTNQRSDQLFAALVAIVPRQPFATSIQVGQDTYPFAFDTAYDGSTSVLTELQKVVMSELGLGYVKADGTVWMESRTFRPISSGVVDTFLETDISDMKPARARATIMSRVQVTIFPRGLGASATDVIYTLQTPTAIGPGQTIIIGPAAYLDPVNMNANVGAVNQVPLVSGTDVVMNSASDGTGTDLTASCSAAATFSANSVTFTVTNNSLQTGYVGGTGSAPKLQCRGQVLRSYGTTVLDQQDVTTRDTYGNRMLQVSMPYQADASIGSDVALYLLSQGKRPITQPQEITIQADVANPSRAARVLARDISDRIALQETVSGLTSATPYFVNAVRWHVDPQQNLTMTFVIAPADPTQYWLLEVAGRSELDATTILGFG